MAVPSLAYGAQAEPGPTSRTLATIAAAHAAEKQAGRQTIQRVLGRQEVRNAAKRAGVEIERAAAAVAVLDGAELAQAVEQARQVEDALAGGGLGMSLALTLLVIFLLFLLILPLAALSAASG